MLTFVLLALPREIRDEVHIHLVLRGDLAILRTSRLVNQEAMNALHREQPTECFPSTTNVSETFSPIQML